MNTGFSKREVNLNNCNNHELARIFNSLLDVIKKKKGRHQSQVAKDTGVTNIGRYKHSGGKLHYYNAKGSEKLRVNVIEKICNHYGFDIDSIEVLGESEDARYFFQLNEDFKNQEYSFYVCYYWGHAQKITTALMEIRNDWHNASMLFFEDDMGSTRSELTGTIKTLGANLFLILQDTQDKYYALISLFIGGTIAKKRKFLTGTYSSASTSSNAPTAGKIILEKYENKQTAILKAKQKEIHPVIFSELFLQRIESIERSVTVAKTLSDFPTFNTVSKLKNYAGVYKGQYLYSSKKTFNTLIMQIYPNGEVRFKRVDQSTSQGIIRLVNDNLVLFGQFERKDIDDYFRIFMVFETEFKKDKVINGIYGGKEKRQASPMAGRIRLQQINPHSADADNAYDRLNPKRHSLVDIEELRKNVPNIDDFIRFFKGEEDNYMESVHLFQQLDLIKMKQTKTINVIKSPKRDLSGIYTGFCLSSYDNSILKYALKIDEKGATEIKDLDGDLYHGIAEYANGMMTILIDNKNKNEKYAWHAMFYIGNSPINSCHHLIGVSTKPTRNGAPSGRLEALYIENELTYQQVVPEKIEFPSEKFDEFNASYEGLGTYLIGEAEKIIKSPRKTDYYYTKPEIDYGYVFFAAACEACRHNKISEAGTYLDKAKNNAYNDLNTIIKARNNDALAQIHPFIDSLWAIE